jgi:hypothetical protein
MSRDDERQPGRGPKPLFRLLRAVLIGVGIFVLLSLLPRLLLRLEGVNLALPPMAIDDEPVYRDAKGQRINQADHDIQLGYEQARQRQTPSHAACKQDFKGFMEMGCHRLVTEQKHIPPYVPQGNWGGGKTTEACRAEVDAYWRAATQDQREQGHDQAADVWTRRNWSPDLRECDNYDNVRISKVVYEPTARLDQLLQRMATGTHATEEDRAQVRRDLALVGTFSEHPARKAYFDKADRFFLLADEQDGATP